MNLTGALSVLVSRGEMNTPTGQAPEGQHIRSTFQVAFARDETTVSPLQG